MQAAINDDDGDEKLMFCLKTVMLSVPSTRDRTLSTGAHYHQLGPGDSVWWHPDLLHLLEEWNAGPAFNSVLYLSG